MFAKEGANLVPIAVPLICLNILEYVVFEDGLHECT